MTPTSVASALSQARALGVAGLDAQVLLAHVLGVPRTKLVANDERVLGNAEAARWVACLSRRAGGEPLAYLLGEKEFYGLSFAVTPDVLIPRPETESMVAWAIDLIGGQCAAKPSVLDLGTGSGAIALAIKQTHSEAMVRGTDVSAAALVVARRNAARLGLDVDFQSSSWWRGLEGQQFDLVVSNPPYVAAGDPHLAALQHEPQTALVAGRSGTEALAEIIAGVAGHLRGGGWLLLEHGFDQAPHVRALLEGAGLVGVQTRRDLGGVERLSGGKLAA